MAQTQPLPYMAHGLLKRGPLVQCRGWQSYAELKPCSFRHNLDAYDFPHGYSTMLAVDADSVLQATGEVRPELAKGKNGQPICFSGKVLQDALLRTRAVELLDFAGRFL